MPLPHLIRSRCIHLLCHPILRLQTYRPPIHRHHLMALEILEDNFNFETFSNESDLEPIIKLVEKDLSEPYSIYTYRFFIYDFPRMCIMVQ